MNKEELETIIKDYIKNNLKVGIICDRDGDGYLNLNISLYLDEEEISKETDSIFMG